MNNPTVGHLGSASNPINQDRKWTAKKSYPLSLSPHHGSLAAHFTPLFMLKKIHCQGALHLGDEHSFVQVLGPMYLH